MWTNRTFQCTKLTYLNHVIKRITWCLTVFVIFQIDNCIFAYVQTIWLNSFFVVSTSSKTSNTWVKPRQGSSTLRWENIFYCSSHLFARPGFLTGLKDYWNLLKFSTPRNSIENAFINKYYFETSSFKHIHTTFPDEFMNIVIFCLVIWKLLMFVFTQGSKTAHWVDVMQDYQC